jgi:hypothetical protein
MVKQPAWRKKISYGRAGTNVWRNLKTQDRQRKSREVRIDRVDNINGKTKWIGSLRVQGIKRLERMFNSYSNALRWANSQMNRAI